MVNIFKKIFILYFINEIIKFQIKQRQFIKEPNREETYNMPQLIPFYFVNQLSFALLAIIYLIFIMSKSVLPYFTLQQVIRVYITKLANK